MELLMHYDWPGNVRELRSAIQHGQIVCDGQIIRPADLPAALRASGASAARRLAELQEEIHLPPTGIDLPAFLGTIERRLVQEALERSNGNQVRAAALLGLSRDQLRYRMARL
jgi:two-component system NtrC family response regulator